MQVRSQKYNPILDLIDDAVHVHGTPVRGKTQKERANDEGRRAGKLEGMCEAIAAFVTRQRLDRFPLSGHVLALEERTVRKSITEGFIHEVKEKFDARVVEINNDSEIDPAQKHEQRQMALGDYWQGLADEVEEWVGINLDFKAEYEGLRRRKVLAGEIEPEVSDENWLAEEIESASRTAGALEELLKTAQAKG